MIQTPIEPHPEILPFLKNLRDQIIQQFETLELRKRFQCTPWDHHSGGGGEINLIRGSVFEKAAVNWSAVSGPSFPMQESSGPFFATGISIITHMKNPYAPTVHFNIRYIKTVETHWFGGGYDLTPMGFSFEEDSKHFHKIAEESLNTIDPSLYPLFSKNAKEYFYIPHRKKERGVGGIFFDHLNTGDWEKDLKIWKNVGNNFLESIMPIYRKRIALPYSHEEKEKQLNMRAHYVEFNLLYDRGTKFGFLSGGNPDAILCSMPPLASW